MKTNLVLRTVAVAAAVGAAAGCADTSPRTNEETAKVSSATTGGSVTPPTLLNPCGGVTWGGSQADLLVADSLAACSAIGGKTEPYRDLGAHQDRYLARLYVLMSDIARTVPGATIAERWVGFRKNPASQCDPNDPSITGGVKITPVVIPPPFLSTPDRRTVEADADIRTATVNLCVAQQLRNRAPGTAGNEAILFADAEQRELLEVIRERAQVAMLQYALLGEAFVLPPPTGTIPPNNPQLRFPLISAWASTASSLDAWGNDFATALQLHGMVTQELGSLFARSRSVRSPRGALSASVTSLGQEYWGFGSWHQRTMALMFGGDPLALPFDKLNPPQPGAPVDATPGTLTSLDWPTPEKSPYFTASILEPQVSELQRLARRFHALDLSFATPQPPPGGCQPFDIPASAAKLYTLVELALRQADCSYPQQPGQCNNPIPPPPPAQFQSYVLWQKHRITPAHATTLVQSLAEALAPLQCGYDPNDAFQGAYDLAGGNQGSGSVINTDSGGQRLFLPSETALVERTLNELEPTFTRIAPFRAPSPYELTQASDVGGFGFNGGCVFSLGINNWVCSADMGAAAEQKRIMGAMAAEAAVREMLISTVAFAKANNSPRLSDYLRSNAQVLRAISANVGDSAVSIVPVVETFPMTGISTVGGAGIGDGVRVKNRGMRVVMTFDGGSSMASTAAPCVSAPSTCTVYAIQGAYAANIGAHPEVVIQTTRNGSSTRVSLATLIAGAGSRSATARVAPGTGGTTGLPTQLVFDPIAVPNDGVYSFVLQVASSTGTGAPAASSYLLAGNTLLKVADFTNGQYIATDGALGTWVQHQAAHDANNPSEPAYDGFDLPNHWVPPFTAELLGGDSQQSSVQAYLSLAQSSADEAVKAVQTAIDGLAQQQKDAAEVQAAVAKAQLALKQDRDTLCGASNTKCDTSLARRTLDPAWYQSVGGLQDASGTDAVSILHHTTYRVVQAFLGTSVDLSNAVIPHLQDPSAPSFAEYGGGQLQEAFIEQWRAVRAPDDRLRALAAVQSAADAEISAANAILSNQRDEAEYACSPLAMAFAIESGVSVGAFGASFSPGPALAQKQKCDSLLGAMTANKAKAAASVQAALASVNSAMVGFTDAQAAIVQSSAKIRSLTAQAGMADARANLDAQLVSATQISAMPIFHRYRDYDMWRAKALLEGARRYALAARRAIEARYVVDFSRMSGGETFVTSPSTWADEVYDYDLSMPSSVGLIVGTPTSDGIYTNKVKDYVGNLQAFLAGYAASRPSAVAHNDIDVLTLPGLQPGASVTSSNPPLTIHPDTGKWDLHCAGAAPTAWVHIDPATGDVTTVCGTNGRVDLARLEFTLDPWGRLNGGIANEPYQKRFNARWGQMAVNFVGTGIKDCIKASDPQGCYSSGFIPYNLTHVGPAWVTDYDEMWRFLGVPRGQVEAGKGLAAEIWLDPLRDGWATSYIAPVARTEFNLRPLGGAYEIEFAVGPEVVLNRIERLQLLVGSSSWVKQQ